MNFGSPLDSVACCLMLVAGRPISQRIFFSIQLQLSQTQTVNIICTETGSQCIAYSGVVPEPLLTHDPSRSRFRVYFKQVFENTYEGKSTRPNSLVAQFGTNSKCIEKAGWFADLGTYVKS